MFDTQRGNSPYLCFPCPVQHVNNEQRNSSINRLWNVPAKIVFCKPSLTCTTTRSCSPRVTSNLQVDPSPLHLGEGHLAGSKHITAISKQHNVLTHVHRIAIDLDSYTWKWWSLAHRVYIVAGTFTCSVVNDNRCERLRQVYKHSGRLAGKVHCSTSLMCPEAV